MNTGAGPAAHNPWGHQPFLATPSSLSVSPLVSSKVYSVLDCGPWSEVLDSASQGPSQRRPGILRSITAWEL